MYGHIATVQLVFSRYLNSANGRFSVFCNFIFTNRSARSSALQWVICFFKGLNFMNDQHPRNSRNLHTSKKTNYTVYVFRFNALIKGLPHLSPCGKKGGDLPSSKVISLTMGQKVSLENKSVKMFLFYLLFKDIYIKFKDNASQQGHINLHVRTNILEQLPVHIDILQQFSLLKILHPSCLPQTVTKLSSKLKSNFILASEVPLGTKY